MANLVRLQYTAFSLIRHLERQLLLASRWLLHWLVFLIIPALSLLIFAPFLLIIGVMALLLSKKRLTNTCPHCENSLSLPFTWEQVSSSACKERVQMD